MPKDEHDLQADLSAALAPHLRHALDSPPRRRILRALNAIADAQTLEELRETIPVASTSTLGYHVLILERAGCVSETGPIVRPNGTLRGYASNIKESRMVLEVLRATKREDDGLGG